MSHFRPMEVGRIAKFINNRRSSITGKILKQADNNSSWLSAGLFIPDVNKVLPTSNSELPVKHPVYVYLCLCLDNVCIVMEIFVL